MEILDACSNSLVDIEDVWKDPEVIPVGSSSSAANSFSNDQRNRTAERPVLSYRNRNTCIDKAEHLELLADSFIPGTHSIFVKTWGCSHNSSDSEYMAGQLASCGYNITDSKNDAHLWLLNSCTVKTPAEQHLQNMITDAYALGKCVVVAGCVPQAAPKTEWLQKLSIVGVQQIDRIVEVVEETLKGNSVRLLDFQRAKAGASLKLPKIRKNALIEILAINSGCLNRCTYCKTKHSRGNLASYPIHELVDRAKQSFDEGCREIWLTSEDLGAYGRDIGVTLPDLLKELVAIIPENAMMRLGMTNPPYILDHLDEIAEILRHPRVYAFLHIPVQSGSDAVLRAMKREYTNADFCRVVDFIRASVPGANVATDLIVGFPTETKEDFDETLHLIDKYRFTSLFTNQFYPRPGTPAAKMKRVDTAEVKRRTKAVTDLFRSYKPYEARIGAIYDVLVTEDASDGVHLVGHNKSYEQVLVPKIAEIMGSFVSVEIVSATKHSMEGRLIAKADVNCNFDVRNHVPAKGTVSGIEAYRKFIVSNPTLSSSKPLVPEKSKELTRLEMARFRNLLADYATSRSSVVIACIVLLAVVYKLVFKHVVW